ncbi:MAG: hypothetical protein KDC90_14920, partial [Ignavibacteriae bacterium]|nr:hypothetical protein [Ignavibacteriota bacterium]
MTTTQDNLTKELNKDPNELFQIGEDWFENYEKTSDLAYKQQAIKYYKAAAKNHHQLAINKLNELGVKYIPKYENIDNNSLSSSQKRLIFLQSLTSRSSLYNVPILLEIEGNLNISSLEKSLRAIVVKHETLRTLVKTINGELIPEVADPDTFKIHISSQPLSRNQIFHLVNQSLTHEFDFSQDIPIIAQLFFCNTGKYYLLLIINHIVIDGWSIDIFLDELCDFYIQYKSNQKINYKPLPIQYFDYAKWQNNWLETNSFAEKQLQFWLDKLEGYEDSLNLPTDRKRPSELSYLGETIQITLPKDLEDKV